MIPCFSGLKPTTYDDMAAPSPVAPARETLSKSLLGLKFMHRSELAQSAETAATAVEQKEHWVLPRAAKRCAGERRGGST